MSTINFDYNLTINQAKQISEVGTNMRTNTINHIKEMQADVDAVWTGDAAKIFKKYLEKLAEDLEKKAKYLIDVGDTLTSAAKQLQQAEEQAKQTSQGF